MSLHRPHRLLLLVVVLARHHDDAGRLNEAVDRLSSVHDVRRLSALPATPSTSHQAVVSSRVLISTVARRTCCWWWWCCCCWRDALRPKRVHRLLIRTHLYTSTLHACTLVSKVVQVFWQKGSISEVLIVLDNRLWDCGQRDIQPNSNPYYEKEQFIHHVNGDGSKNAKKNHGRWYNITHHHIA